MKFREVLSSDSSRLIADMVVDGIGRDQQKFDEVMHIAKVAPSPVNWRAARAADLSCTKYPELFHPWLGTIVDKLEFTEHDSVLRSHLRILIRYTKEMDEEQMGKTFDFAFETLFNENKAVALRYYSMEILVNIVKREPELKDEVKMALEDLLSHSNRTFKNAIRRIMKKLK